jgi:hypothetical protein
MFHLSEDTGRVPGSNYSKDSMRRVSLRPVLNKMRKPVPTTAWRSLVLMGLGLAPGIHKIAPASVGLPTTLTYQRRLLGLHSSTFLLRGTVNIPQRNKTGESLLAQKALLLDLLAAWETGAVL